MRILHLADIHFRSPECLNPTTDPDVAFRSRLEADLVELCTNDNIPVDIILVGGDIAFKGHVDEYEVAKRWLLRLAKLCGCGPSGILTVPGNHDMNRSICASVAVSNAQDAIAKEVGDHERDRQMSRQLGDDRTGTDLFKPLEAYNEFAAQFGCSVYPKHPFWQKDLELAEDVTLRIFGLTSVLISGAGDRDSAPGQLFLGSAQVVLNPQNDVMNLVLCHHPPSWFSDESRADGLINARAQLQFFGHEHKQRGQRPPEYFRFMAGAVNPDRREPQWDPGYNLVDLEVVGEGLNRFVEVKARLRHYQGPPSELFVPVLTQRREEIWSHQLSLPKKPSFTRKMAPTKLKVPNLAETSIASADHAAVEEAAADVHPKLQTEVDVTEPSTDNLIFRFWQLSSSQMRDIALELGLMTKDDMQVPPHERYRNALNVAKQKGLLIELAKLIEKNENNV
ncbi:metallophosphoesterase [Chitinimonas sp. BJB300]|uniref:metallophosphoesterase n=1 Tax=Chitinimonas sp. BJB300 TaxID=1559339 RepID=UPI000C0D7763|nr:metallophosphoesterase [Chitinimonas sp. BJB300]PHV10315.1 hypothetical protein CSQ89_16905 [Chitinimonas sp. BJB300]TSJ83293.1 metallophosphoesterase [Chitinimonas sp. BJB300]